MSEEEAIALLKGLGYVIRRRKTAAHAAEMKRRYDAGEGTIDIGRSLGFNPGDVSRQLRVSGAEMRPKGRPKRASAVGIAP